jgi:hypothetical protein
MGTSLKFTVQVAMDWLYKEDEDVSDPAEEGQVLYNKHFADGTGAGQCDLVWRRQVTLAASGVGSHQLDNLAYTWFGTALTTNFANIKFMAIINAQTEAAGSNPYDLEIDTSRANAWTTPFNTTTLIEIPSGGMFMLTNHADSAGWVVTNGADILYIVNKQTAETVTYKIVLAGDSN